MTYFGRFYIPPISAAVNVAWETVKALIPEDSPCVELIQKATGRHHPPGDAENGGVKRETREPTEHDNFAQFNGPKATDNTEMATMSANYGSADNNGEENGEFEGRQVSFSKSRATTFESGCSFDEFGEGRGRHKINEWQAAWNVTNAIQVTP